MAAPRRKSDEEKSPRANNTAFAVHDPVGREIFIPASADDDFAYFAPNQRAEICDYWDEYGYVVVRDLVPKDDCDAAMAWFGSEVASSDRFIYRQTSARPERHEFTPHGFVLNPILNVQSLDGRWYPNFREAGLRIVTHSNVQGIVHGLLEDAGKLVQSMYFQGNSQTWAHQDTYYLDAEEIGRMVGGWFAMEDIAPGAGRFYIYPGSHRIDIARNGGAMDVAFHHDRYKAHIIEQIDRRGLECRAPALRQGDVLFWSSRTLHGSLETRQPDRSRSSFTAHYIPDSSRFLQFQKRIRKLNLHQVSGMRVHKPKDLDQLTNRTVLWVETTFPETFALAKKVAIKALTR